MSTPDHGRIRTDGNRPFVFPPPGLDVCGTCGEYWGTTQSQWFAGRAANEEPAIVIARCECRACGRCGRTIGSREPRPRWSQEGHAIWLSPGRPGLSAICPFCREPSGPAIHDATHARRAIAIWYARNYRPTAGYWRLGRLFPPGTPNAPRDSYSSHGVDLHASHYWHQSLYRHKACIVDGGSSFLVLDGRNGEVVHMGSGFY